VSGDSSFSVYRLQAHLSQDLEDTVIADVLARARAAIHDHLAFEMTFLKCDGLQCVSVAWVGPYCAVLARGHMLLKDEKMKLCRMRDIMRS